MNINYNKIKGILEICNLVEIDCVYNEIDGIISPTLKYINAYNNKIIHIHCPNIIHLIIYNNIIEDLPILKKIKILHCSNTNIKTIDYMESLKELVCSTNSISKEYSIKNIDFMYKSYYVDFY